MSEEILVRVNVKLTQMTHRLFKAWCAERGKTLQSGIGLAVEEMMKRKLGGAAALGMAEAAPGVWRYPERPAAAGARARGIESLVAASGEVLAAREAALVVESGPVDDDEADDGWDPNPPEVVPGHARNEEGARAGPITGAEFVVPATWVARDGVTRAENLKRYGEDETIEYWPPIAAAGLDVDAPVLGEDEGII